MTSSISTEEWELRKSKIKKLYVEKGYQLKVVRQKLANQGFQPSESQYRTRFKIWKLRKSKRAKDSTTATESAPSSPDQNFERIDLGKSSDAEFLDDEASRRASTSSFANNQPYCNHGTEPVGLNIDHQLDAHNNIIRDFSNSNDSDWIPSICNESVIKSITVASSEPPSAFAPSDAGRLHCSPWLEKSTMMSPQHPGLEVSPSQNSIFAPKVSGDPSLIEASGLPFHHVSAQEIPRRMPEDPSSDSLTFPWL